jgi:hypothetical protein
MNTVVVRKVTSRRNSNTNRFMKTQWSGRDRSLSAIAKSRISILVESGFSLLLLIEELG